MAEKARYFVIAGPPDVLCKREGASVAIWRDGDWKESAVARRRLSGAGGDADSREITAAQAKKLMAK